MTEQAFETRTDQINLSPVAAAKVKSLLEQEGRDDLALRISVQPGGCSGLRYQLFFDERSLDTVPRSPRSCVRAGTHRRARTTR